MATVTNWIDHLSADEVVGAVYPGAGSMETKVLVEKQMFMHMKKVKETKAFLDITLFLLLK